MANPNYRISVTLEEANVIRRALTERLAAVAALLGPPPAVADPEELDALREEAGRLQTMLRRDF